MFKFEQRETAMKRHTIRLPFSTKPHWIAGAPAIFLFGMAWALLEIGLAAGFKGQHESLLSAITLTIIGFGVYEALKTMLWIHRTRLTLTESGLLWESGIIKKRLPTSVDYADIINVNAVVHPVGQLFDYGFLRVDTIDGRPLPLFPVTNISLVTEILEHKRSESRKSKRSNLNE
ncbi:PH domain-containing protein [Marinobacter sp. MBR-105]|jgi:uncharacterized membrane protein YdbT with pleckstrin-like domain